MAPLTLNTILIKKSRKLGMAPHTEYPKSEVTRSKDGTFTNEYESRIAPQMIIVLINKSHQ